MKACTKCGVEKDESEFYITKGTPEGKCKVCRDIQIKKWRNENKQNYLETQKIYNVNNRIMNVTIETCKEIAKVVNLMPKNKTTVYDFSEQLKKNKCPYLTFVSSFLSQKYGFYDEEKDRKVIVMPKEPIYFNVFKIYFDSYKPALKTQPIPKVISHPDILPRPVSISITNPIQRIAESHKYPPTISQYSDAELAAELRLRGFEITAKKTIEL